MIDSTEKAREIWFESAGARLFAIERGRGRGRALVYFHGGLADHRSSSLRLGALAESHRLITPDARGAGRSKHAGDLGWDLFADDVLALMTHLGIDRAVVGGTSAGSAIALTFARRHPEKTLALVLVSPVYAGQETGLTEAQRIAMDRMNEAGERALTEGIEALCPLFEALPEPIRGAALTMARSFDPPSVAATTRFLASGVEPFQRIAELETLSMPTLIVAGADPEHPAEVAALYARAIPNAVFAAPAGDLALTVAEFLRDAIDSSLA